MEDILDEHSKNPISKELYESIKWWEKRRFFYNIAIGASGLFPILKFWNTIETVGYFDPVLGILIYGFLVNICYCFGWGIDILKSFYLENPSYGKSKTLLLVLGVILSMWFTIILAWNTLHLMTNYPYLD